MSALNMGDRATALSAKPLLDMLPILPKEKNSLEFIDLLVTFVDPKSEDKEKVLENVPPVRVFLPDPEYEEEPTGKN
jgi:hypothetical protein